VKRIPQHFSGRRIAVLGAGRSGMAAVRLILNHGGEVFLSDIRFSAEIEAACRSIEHRNYDFELGKHSGRVREYADMLVVSPGIPLDVPVVAEARKHNVPVVGELELSARVCGNPIIAVTGTNGKSTTTSMIGSLFDAGSLPARVAGNIGIAFADIVDELNPDETVILEVSSYQLESIERFHPWIAVILNVTSDHLKRHKTMEEYVRCKLRILENQTGDDAVILNRNDDILRALPGTGDAQLLWFNNRGSVSRGAGMRNGVITYFGPRETFEIMPGAELPVPGLHNLDNALAAAAAAVFAGISPDKIAKGLRTYKELEHRLEPAGVIGGVSFVNDSKATNVDALAVALRSFSSPVILIAGGEDKGSDLSVVNNLIKERVAAIALIGEAADRMFETWKSAAGRIEKLPDLESAVSAAFRMAQPGDTVLFSPACASFDMFHNFEERGRIFKEIVRRLPQK